MLTAETSSGKQRTGMMPARQRLQERTAAAAAPSSSRAEPCTDVVPAGVNLPRGNRRASRPLGRHT